MMTIQEFEKWLVNWIVDDYHQRIHNGIKEKENIEINPYFRFENGLSESNGKTVGLPTIPTNLEQLKFDILPFEKRVLSRNGIRLFGLEYNAPIIAKLRINQKNQKIKHIIKYDPRDIREVYLWSEWKRQYYNIPIKKVYYSQLMINPEDENDIPLGLKELEKIKKINSKKSPIKEYNLIKSMEQRQKLINESKKKTKTAKKSRKIEEVRNVYKTKATSTQIRKNKKKHIKDTSNEYENECKEFNLDWLKKNTFPSRSRWKEDEF